jgi:CDP-paratose 2-epimerase
MYGPNQFGGEDHGWLANFSIRQVMGRPITLFGTGKQVRDVIYVSDVVAAIHAFYERRVPGVYNIGGGFPMTVSLMESIALIEELTGSSADVRLAPMRLGDLHYFACEIGRAASLLGWRPSVTPREGVRKLVEWVQANRSLFDGDHAIPPNGVVPNS